MTGFAPAIFLQMGFSTFSGNESIASTSAFILSSISLGSSPGSLRESPTCSQEKIIIIDRKDKDEDKDKYEGKDRERCFEYVMPYTMIMPDSSTITISEEGDSEQIENWYDENSKEEKRPKVQFPVDIIFLSEEEDKEEVLTLTSSDDLKEVMDLLVQEV